MFGLIFTILIIIFVVRAIATAKAVGRGIGMFGGGNELDLLFKQLEQQMRQYQSLPPEQRRAQDAQMTAMWLQMNNQMRSIDSNHRAMYENRVGEISSYAAQNGIDFTPPSW